MNNYDLSNENDKSKIIFFRESDDMTKLYKLKRDFNYSNY